MATRRGAMTTYTTWQVYIEWLGSATRSIGSALCMSLLRINVSRRGRKGRWTSYRNLLKVARGNEWHVHHCRHHTKGVTRTSVSHNDVVRRIGVGPSPSGRMDCGRHYLVVLMYVALRRASQGCNPDTQTWILGSTASAPHDKGVVIFWNLQVGHLWPSGGPEGVRTNPGGSDVDAA